MSEDEFSEMVNAMTTAAIDKIPAERWHELGDFEKERVTRQISESLGDILDDAWPA